MPLKLAEVDGKLLKFRNYLFESNIQYFLYFFLNILQNVL